MHRTIGDSYGVDGGKNVFRPEGTGYDATQLTYDSVNALQEEIANVIEGASISLNSASENIAQMNQLKTAIDSRATTIATTIAGSVNSALDARLDVLEGQTLNSRINVLEGQTLDSRLDVLENATLDARLDILEGQTLDSRLDVLENATPAISSFTYGVSVNGSGSSSVSMGASVLEGQTIEGIKVEINGTVSFAGGADRLAFGFAADHDGLGSSVNTVIGATYKNRARVYNVSGTLNVYAANSSSATGTFSGTVYVTLYYTNIS